MDTKKKKDQADTQRYFNVKTIIQHRDVFFNYISTFFFYYIIEHFSYSELPDKSVSVILIEISVFNF